MKVWFQAFRSIIVKTPQTRLEPPAIDRRASTQGDMDWKKVDYILRRMNGMCASLGSVAIFSVLQHAYLCLRLSLLVENTALYEVYVTKLTQRLPSDN